jgi:hypothetical protein
MSLMAPARWSAANRVQRILDRHGCRRQHLQRDGALAVHSPQLCGAYRALDRGELADHLYAGFGRVDGQAGEILWRRPLAAPDEHVEPLVAVEMPAGIEATGKRAHGIGNSTAVEAGLCDPDIVRHELQFRLRQRRAGQGSHRPLAEPLVDGILPDPRRVHQGHEFGTLQVDVDVAATGYADVQKRCTRYERLRARQSDEDLFAQLADEFVGFTRIRGVDVNARRVRAVGIQVIAVDARAGLTVDVGLEAADYFGDEFVLPGRRRNPPAAGSRVSARGAM